MKFLANDGKTYKAEQWYFSVVDAVRILTGSSIPKRYWSDLKKKLRKEGSQVYDKEDEYSHHLFKWRPHISCKRKSPQPGRNRTGVFFVSINYTIADL